MADERERSVTVDEFLRSQVKITDLVTIQNVPTKPGVIRITPYLDDSFGCGCETGLEIPQSMVEAVTPTDQTHHCCGEILRVARVLFREEARLSVADIFAQFSAQARALSHRGGFQIESALRVTHEMQKSIIDKIRA